MKILIVEDEEYKREHVQKFIAGAYPEVPSETAESFQSAVRKLSSDEFGLIVLDMTLPTFDKHGPNAAGRLRHLGGREIFDQVRRRRLSTRIVVLTGYDILGEGSNAVPLDDVSRELGAKYPELFIRAIFYSRAEDKWMKELRAVIDEVMAGSRP